jgi:hypothetical protein
VLRGVAPWHLTCLCLLLQGVGNDIPNVPAPTPNEVGTPGGVPGLDLTKEVCANVTPNVRGDSRFPPYYLTYGQNFNKARRPACPMADAACPQQRRCRHPCIGARP